MAGRWEGAAAQESSSAESEDGTEDEEADQLAVASSTQEQLVSAAELPGVGGAPSPLALLIATAGGGTAAGAAPILPLAPQHFR